MGRQKHKKILIFCVTLSLLLHGVGVYFLRSYSHFFTSARKADVNKRNPPLSKRERDEILDVALTSITQTPTKEPTPYFNAIATFEKTPQEPIHFQKELFLKPPELPIFSYTPSLIDLTQHLPKQEFKPYTATICPMQMAMKPPAANLSQDVPKIAPTVLPSAKTKKHRLQPKFPSLEELNTLSLSDSFDADLIFMPLDDDTGYLFALTLLPKSDLELPRIRQHFTFLIDKSNSIQQGRLSATKSAIHKAIGELCQEDTFNIIAFDSKIEKMAPTSLPCEGKSLAVAEGFLEKIQLGSFFSTSDLYKALFLTVPTQEKTDEIHTAILLTDGEIFAKKPSEKAILSNWTRYNEGKVSLYAIGLNSDTHLATLDAVTVFNRGKLSNAPTARGLKRKLLKLLKNIQNPIAKNLSCTAISNTQVTLFPHANKLPNLYLDQPYVILGQTKTLDDFHLFVQGRVKDQWINIKKTISFVNGKKGTKSLKQEWALQSAYALYDAYLLDNDINHIAEAARLLEPYNYQVAFQ